MVNRKEYKSFRSKALEKQLAIQCQKAIVNAGALASNAGPKATLKAIEETKKLLSMQENYLKFRWIAGECGLEGRDIRGNSRSGGGHV